MNRKVCLSLLASIFLSIIFLAACGSNSNSATSKTSAVEVATTSGTPQGASVSTAFPAPLIATVTSAGVPVSGMVVTFGAPKSGPSGTFAGGVNTATSDANGIATSAVFTANPVPGAYAVTASIADGSSASFRLANNPLHPVKNFAFYLSGRNNDSEDLGEVYYALAGAVIIDSTGAVLAGEQDYNDYDSFVSPEPSGDIITGGTLQANPQFPGQGTLTLITNNANLGVNGTETLGIQFVNNNHALVIEYDGVGTSSGSIDLQTLQTNTPSGSYAFTLSGEDNFYRQTVYGGVFAVSGTSVTGVYDLNDIGNDKGAVLDASFTGGTISAPDAFGRGTLTSKLPGIPLNYYIVGPEAIRLINVSASSTGAGSAFGQGASAGTFSNTSIGTSVFAIESNVVGSGTLGTGNSYAAAGHFTVPSSGTISGVGDNAELGAGFSYIGSSISGTYTIANSGYGSLATGLGDINTLGIYMTDPSLNLGDPNNTTSGGGGALIADMDGANEKNALAGTGVLIPQIDTAAGDFKGNYAFGSQSLFVANGGGEFDFVGQGYVSSLFNKNSHTLGIGISGSGIASDPATYINGGPPAITQVPFNGVPVPDEKEAVTGRYTMLSSVKNALNFGLNSEPFTVVMYQASGGQLFWLDLDADIGLTFLGPIEQQGALASLNGIAQTPIIATTSGTPQSVAVSSAFSAPLIATVTQGGLPVSGVLVTFSPPNNRNAGGFFTGKLNTAITDANGFAVSSEFTANGITGSYGVTASIADGSVATFSLTNVPAPDAIATTSGTPQNTEIDNLFAAPLVATVTQGGVPVSGVQVTFTAPASGASGTFPQPQAFVRKANRPTPNVGGPTTDMETTDSNGIATSAAFTANGTTGSYAVTASITGGSTASFNLTNAVPIAANHFSFYLNGMDDDADVFYALVGSVTIDSNGAVLGGEQDYNDADLLKSPEPAGDTILAGELLMNPELPGQGTLILVTSNSSLGTNNTETLGVQFVNNNHALITEFDGLATSAGSMDLQTLQASPPSGSYAFTISGEDSEDFQTVWGGVISIDGSTVTGVYDVNDLGNDLGPVLNQSFDNGTITAPDAFGRGTINLTLGMSLNYYVVGPEVIRLIDVDTGDAAFGSAFGQGTSSGTFSASSLGSSVFGLESNGVESGLSYAVAGQFTVSSGTFTGQVDENFLGDGAGNVSLSGNYTIGANGRGHLAATSGSFTNVGTYMTDPTLNLIDPNNTTSGLGGALLADMDGNSDSSTQAGTGVLIPQSDTATAHFTGPYAFGAQAFITGPPYGFSEFDFVGQGSVTETSGTSINGTGIASDPNEYIGEEVIDTFVPFSGNPLPDGTEASTGRYTMLNSASNPLNFGPFGFPFSVVIYQASGGQLFWVDLDESNELMFLGPIEQQGDLSSLSGIPAVKKTKPITTATTKQKPKP